MTPDDLYYLALTAWGEARGDGIATMEAICHVILNRVADDRWPDIIREVVEQPGQFAAWSIDGPNLVKMLAVTLDNSIFREAYSAALRAIGDRANDPTGGATHYFANYIDKPSWAEDMRVTLRVGTHIFMKG